MIKEDQMFEEIIRSVNQARYKILLFGESSLSRDQFHAFRKLVLDEFGRYGIEGRLRSLFKKDNNGFQAGTDA
jgi:hypothetical protein